jgi:Protein of unknown function (DUF1360)
MNLDPSHAAASVVIALAVSAVSMSMTQGSIFASFRTWTAERNKWLGELFACFFCLSHWIAFATVAVFLPRPIRSGFFFADLVLAAFAIIALATITSGVSFRVFLAAMEVHRLRAEREAKIEG